MLSVIYAESFILSVIYIYAECRLCWVSVYAECHLCWVSFIQSV